jgi:hypothetical protein
VIIAPSDDVQRIQGEWFLDLTTCLAVVFFVGDLLAYCCQFQKLLFGGRVFSRFGQFSIFFRLLAKVVGKDHWMSHRRSSFEEYRSSVIRSTEL